MEMLQGIRATSKASLKLQCLFATQGDVREAKELYEFFASDMGNLPDYDPVAPTWVDSTKDAANGLFEWVKENKDTLAQAYDFVRDLVGRRGGTALYSAGTTAADAAGAMGNAAGAVGSAAAELPPINV